MYLKLILLFALIALACAQHGYDEERWAYNGATSNVVGVVTCLAVMVVAKVIG